LCGVEGTFTNEAETVTIRCLLDGLMLEARVRTGPLRVQAFDGDESFVLEAVEALYYEIVSATREELLNLERACFRLLRRAADFRHVEDKAEPRP
jgi:hypothetical protein